MQTLDALLARQLTLNSQQPARPQMPVPAAPWEAPAYPQPAYRPPVNLGAGLLPPELWEAAR